MSNPLDLTETAMDCGGTLHTGGGVTFTAAAWGTFVKSIRAALSAPAAATSPEPASRAVRGLQALRTVLGIDSPETRGWAPAVQQESRRAIDRAIAALTPPAAASWEAPIELPALPEPEGIDGDCGQWGPGRVYAYTAGQMQAYARDYARAALAAAPAEPKTKDQTGGHSVAAPSLPSGAASEAVRSLQALRVVIGIDSPETRGWAPAVQQEARRAIDRALVVLAKQGPK